MNDRQIIRGMRPGTGPSFRGKPYVYQGSIPLHADPDILGPKRDRAACGTPAGHKRHRREGTEYCQECRDAVAAESKARRDAAREAREAK